MKRKLFALLPLLMSTHSLAQSLPEQLQACQQIDSGVKRLDCYDQLARQTATSAQSSSENVSSKGMPPKSAPNPVPAARAQAKAEAEFGLSEAQKQKDKPKVDRIEARVAKKQKGPRGKWVITLDNGQVWKQKDSEYFSFPDNGAIYIKEGIFGAYYLSAEDTNRTIKVKRLQ